MRRVICIGRTAATELIKKRLDHSSEEIECVILETRPIGMLDRTKIPALFKDLNINPIKWMASHGGYHLKNEKESAFKEITRINTLHKKIYFNDRSQMDFDDLVLADLPLHRRADIKGIKKTGVADLYDWSDLIALRKQCALHDNMTIKIDDILSLDIALALSSNRADILLFQSQKSFLSKYLPDSGKEILKRLFLNENVSIEFCDGIQEVLGDQEMKAIRSQKGKVFAAQALLTDDIYPDKKIFSGDEIQIGEGILVNNHYQTNIDHIYACDWVGELEVEQIGCGSAHDQVVMEYQAQTICASILSTEQSEKVSPQIVMRNFGRFSMVLGGVLRKRANAEVFECVDEETLSYQFYQIHEGILIGGAVINQEQYGSQLKHLLGNSPNVSGRERELFADCFKVEQQLSAG